MWINKTNKKILPISDDWCDRNIGEREELEGGVEGAEENSEIVKNIIHAKQILTKIILDMLHVP